MKTLKLKRIIYFVCFLFLLLNMNYAYAIPHTILGYVQYDDGISTDDFNLAAYNNNLDEYFYNITLGEDGLYYFDVGT